MKVQGAPASPEKAMSPVLQKLLSADKKAKKRFSAQGLEIAKYGWAPNYDFEYQTLPQGAFFKAKVALTAEAIKVFGPYLYQENPHRTATVKPWSDENTQRRTTILQDYLNYTPGEYDYFGNSRRCIDEAIPWGRSAKLTTRDPDKPQVITSRQVSVRNIWIDGDASSIDTIKRVWVRCVKNRSEVAAMYPDAAETIKKLPPCTKRFPDDQVMPGEDNALSGEGVEYLEMWSLLPLSTYKDGAGLANDPNAPQHPQKYACDMEGNCFWSGDWEIPFYLDGAFPISFLDFYPYPDGPWPVSPLQDGVCYQRAINWVVTMMMGKYRFTSRTLLALVNQNEQGISDTDSDKVLVGRDVESLSVKVNGENKNINDFIQQFDWSNEWINAAIQMMNMFQERFEKSTGLYGILYAGETPTQVRSATDATMKDRNSQSRINTMRGQVIRFERDVARKEAMAARYLLTRDDINVVMGSQAAQDWGFLIKPDQAGIQQWAQQFIGAGLQPEQAIKLAQEKMADAVDLTKWARETDYDIEPDSLQKPNTDTQISAYKEMSNQLIPTLIQSPNPQIQANGFDMQANYLKLIGASMEDVTKVRQIAELLRSTPPPQPVQPPMGPQ
jgi:hypothetical protein